MINSKLLYQIYIEVINLRINELLEESISYHTVHNNLMKRLYEYNPYIELCTNYSLSELLEFTDLKKFNKIYFSTDEVFINNKIYKKDILNMYLKNYIDINKIVVSNEEKINKLKSKRIDYKKYYNVIKSFNRLTTDAMIEEGYVFNPGNAFGLLYISTIEFDKPRVNLPESMKVKKKLIKEGKIPYNKKEEKEYIKKGLPYNGIKYFVYYPKVDFMVVWKRSDTLKKFYNFINEFKYVPPHTDFEGSYHAKMRNFIKENKNKALILYDRKSFNVA